MSDIALRVDSVGKKYLIAHQQRERYTALRDVLANKAKSLGRRVFDLGRMPIEGARSRKEEFWALKDISFEVKKGERIGIIGRNGAGKSTLLKLLSRITEPSTGCIELHGRVASLLEVGTGFHPELTGRENIYLNGAILGMGRAEIKQKFDEIVDFAEVEKFLDVPVKRYSSGMYVRLAFAVAAHLEPEILVVDEVLAVGDIEFQKKCIGKMNEVAKGGRTILFVSHNMQAINSLCSRAILLAQGCLYQDGPVGDVVQQYLLAGSKRDGEVLWGRHEKSLGDGLFHLKAMRLLKMGGEVSTQFRSDEPIRIQMEFELIELPPNLVVGYDLCTPEGLVVYRCYHNDSTQADWPALTKGYNRLEHTIPLGLLNAGSFTVNPRICLHCQKWIVHSDAVLTFDVTLMHGQSPFWHAVDGTNRPGVIAPIMPWRRVN